MSAHNFNPDDGGEDIRAVLAAEACARLHEWGDARSFAEVTGWITRLAALNLADPHALETYIRWVGGGAEEIAKSFGELAAERATSRQNMQQQFTRTLAAIQTAYPELAQAMRAAFEAHAPEARSDANRQSW